MTNIARYMMIDITEQSLGSEMLYKPEAQTNSSKLDVCHIIDAHPASQSIIGRTNDHSDEGRNSGIHALPNNATNKCEMKKETDDFENYPSFEEESRAVEGKRPFSNT